jgi:hypothetical protein
VLEAATERVAVDGSHDRLGGTVQDFVRRPLGRCPRLAKLTDIGAGDEAAACTDHHHGLDARVCLALLERFDDAIANAGSERVDGRVVDGDDADPILHVEPHERLVACRVRHAMSSSLHCFGCWAQPDSFVPGKTVDFCPASKPTATARRPTAH